MFTGLIEERGVITAITERTEGIDLTVQAELVLDDLQIDHSIALNGCCQTVVELGDGTFQVTAIAETMRKTTFGLFEVGTVLNLERAVRVGDRLGGHIVQGHVDTTGEVVAIEEKDGERLMTVSFDESYDPLVIPIGSIVVDGVSLTVARKDSGRLTVAIIPHTWRVTTFGNLSVGDRVNLEFDMIGKYVRNLLPGERSKLS